MSHIYRYICIVFSRIASRQICYFFKTKYKFFIDIVALGAEFITFKRTRIPSACCSSTQLISCKAVFVSPDLLGLATLTLPGGIKVTFSNNIAGNENA